MNIINLLCLALCLSAAHNFAGQESCGRLRDLYGQSDAKPLGQRFDLVGQVMFWCDENPRRITIIDKDQPRSMCFWDASTNTPAYQSGDRVRLRGTFSRANETFRRQVPNHPNIPIIEQLEVISHDPLPETVLATAQEINTFRTGNKFIHVCGVLVSVFRDQTNAEWNWLVLKSDSTKVLAAATEHDYPYDTLLGLLDADIKIRGIVHKPGTWWKSRGHHVILYGTNGIETVSHAPDPFAAPHFVGAPMEHRQQATGQVLGTGLNKIFLQTDNGTFLPVSPVPGSDIPTPGEWISVSGFVEMAPAYLQMTAAVIRREPNSHSIDTPILPVNPESLFTTPTGERLVDASRLGKVIQLRGRIANSADGIRTDRRIILECGKRTFTVDVAHLLDTLDTSLANGCHISVTGICLTEFDTDAISSAFPQFKGFVIVPRTAADIVVVQQPSWWTPGRLLCVIAVLVLGLIGIFIWNRMLKLLSERRGRELAEEQITSARADLKVEERTRLAVELHDSISQTLTGVALQIDAAQGSGKSNPAAAERFLETARAMLASCRQELRCCIWDLKSRAFEAHNMTEAIEKTIAPHLGATQIQVRFNVPRTILSESSAHDVLRIVRELVMNAIRHGQAKHIRIAGECRDGTVRFSVRDDGTGFSEADIPGPSQGHFGLQGIRERIGNRNGEISIRSTPGIGTKITVVFSADEREIDES